MKSAGAALDTHLQGETTSLATCWKVKRRDGTAFHFTDHDVDLTVDIGDGDGDQVYLASSSYNRTAVKNDDSLSVDNLDLTGVLDSTTITEDDMRKGLFDFAEVHIFLVNWADLTQGILRMRKGWLGEVTLSPNGFFQSELRGLTQAFSRKVGQLYSPECRADLGDARCKVPILPEVAKRSKAYAVGDYVRASSALEGLFDPVFLAHLDTDVDDIALGAPGTLGSQAALSTVQKKFGAASVEFSHSGSKDPAASFVEYPDNDAYTIGSQPFTIECFARFKNIGNPTFQGIMSHWLADGNQRSWFLETWNLGFIRFIWSSDGTAVNVIQAIHGTWVNNQWYHFAVTRDGSNNLRIFTDGVLRLTTTLSASLFAPAAKLRLGKIRGLTDDEPMNGFIDEPRITIGTALYTSSFTPPSAPFSGGTAAVIAGLTCEDYDDVIYKCTTAGTTAAAQPAYDTTIGNDTTDGTAVFTAERAWSRCITVSALGANVRKEFTVTELTPNSGAGTDGRDQFPDDSMNGGVVVWETGANAGVAMEVRDFVADDGVTITQDLELFLELPFDIQVGDKARVYRGCFKRSAEDCVAIFNNIANFRGEPFVPGQDLLFSYPDAKA